MTPQQEERLGRLMATRARREGRIQKLPSDPPLPANAKEDDVKKHTIGLCLPKGG